MKNGYHLRGWLAEKYTGFFTRQVFVFIFACLLQPSALLYAQDNSAHETEARLKKAAVKYFEKDDFMEAYPLYSQLLSLYPGNPDYNYHFGACMLFTKADKNKAVDYIEFAVEHPPVDDLTYYYLGRALHLNYRFNAAIQSYKKFVQVASSSELKKYPVAYLIDMCDNGKQLLANLQGLDVLRKKELNLSDYIEAYDMHSNGGVMLAEPEIFKTKLDKERTETNFIYLTPDKSEAFFSSYGNKGDNGKDIYVAKRDLNGNWGTPENLGNVINTASDEDYPVYDAPRHTLYFSSKGHNSMGGYDIFSSVYDDSTDTWSEPVNMDFPINTPDDDILFVPDTAGKTAFFASTRSSPQGTIDVYRIVLHLHPPASVVVAGTAYKDDGKTPAFCIITVRDTKTNNIIKVATTSPENGNYSFSLPNGGSYNFTIEDSSHKAQSQAVVLPVEQNASAMKQNIEFDSSGALKIKSYQPAGGIPEDSDYRLAYNYIKQQAQMDVNVDTNSIQTLLAQSTASVTANVNSNSSPEKGGNDNTGVLNTGSSDTAQLAQGGQQVNTETANAIDYASDKLQEAQQLQARATAILNNTDGNDATNSDSISVAKNLLQQSAISEEKGMEAYRLAAEDENSSAKKQPEINTTGNSNSSAPVDTISSGQTQVNNQTASKNNSGTLSAKVSPGDLIRSQAEQVKEDSLEVAANNDALTQEVNGLQQKAQSFVTQAGQTSNSQEKVAFLQQADDLSESAKIKQQEIKENNGELQQLHNQYEWLNKQSKKADSAFIIPANSGGTNPALFRLRSTTLQQEINEYAAANNIDSSSAENSSNNIPGNETAVNNASPKPSYSKHSRYKKNIHQTSPSDSIAAASPQAWNSANSNQNTALANNNTSTTSTNNTSTISDTSSATSSVPNSPTLNNNSDTLTASANNNSTANTTPSSTDSVPNSQTLNNNSDTSTANANNNSTANTTPLSTNSVPNSQTLNNNSDTSTASANNNSTANTTTSTTNSGNSQTPNNNTSIASVNNTSTISNAPSTTGSGNSQTVNNNTSTGSTNNTSNNALATSTSPLPPTDSPNSPVNAVPAVKVSEGPVSESSQTSNHIPVTSIQYTDTIALDLNQKSQQYFTEATSLAENIQEVQNEAGDEKDADKSKVLYHKVDSLNEVVSQLNLKGDEALIEADYRQYRTNSNQIAGTTIKPGKSETGKVSTAQKMLSEGDFDYRKSVSERDSADNTSGAAKQTYTELAKKDLATAILSQQKAVYLFFEADSEQAANAPATELNSDQPPAPASSADRETTAQTNSDIHFTYSDSSKTTNEKATSVFKEVSESPYSTSNPIQIDSPLPTGVIFKVQVGAFRKPIPQDLFKGIEPITGTTSPEGYIRYSAGVFTTFNAVNDGLEKIRNMGYTGAFIVAFYNGKRITVREALAKLGVIVPGNLQTNHTQGITNSHQLIANSYQLIDTNAAILGKNTLVPSKETLIDNSRKNRRAIKDTMPPAAVSFKHISGLVFTVQVGSFSKHKGFIRLRKIKHLYSWTDKNGTIKYNSGTYNSIAAAKAARDIIVANTPVKDAFVSAYYNGERITTAKAKELLIANSPVRTGTPARSEQRSGGGGHIADSGLFQSDSQISVIYTVQIASFAGELPIDVANKLLKYASVGIEPHREKQGLTTYYAGKFADFDSANALQLKLFNEGFHRAIVIPYYHGKEISLKEAQSINNK